MKNFKKKNIIIGLIAILMVMSVGFVVNSYYVNNSNSEKAKYYSEALNRNFTEDGKVIYDENEKKLAIQEDTIASNLKDNAPTQISPSEQGWDKLGTTSSKKTKNDRILITKGLVIDKKSQDGTSAVKGIHFYQDFKDGDAIKTIYLGETGKDGKLTIPQNKLVPGESDIVEKQQPNKEVNHNTENNTTIKGEVANKVSDTEVEFKATEFKVKRTPVYVDPEVRFLGEVDGSKIITYENLREQIAKQKGKTNSTELWGDDKAETGTWLKFYNNKDKRIYYVAKTPVVMNISKENMDALNLFDGVTVQLSEDPSNTQKLRSVVVRTLNSEQKIKTGLNDTKEITTQRGSEWNNYIESILGNEEYNLGKYSFNNDLQNKVGKETEWLKEDKISTEGVKAFRPILQAGKCYDDACFEGEVLGNDFITYNKLLSEITGQGENYIKVGRCINNPDINANDNCGGLGAKLSEGKDIGGNWLKIYDAREGKTLYIAKKPLTNHVSWNKLYKAGVVYGPDVLNIEEENGKLVGKRNPNKLSEIIGENEGEIKTIEYRGKIIKIKGKNYIVRLLKAYNVDKNGGDPNKLGNTGYQDIKNLQHSEWNRYILPLVKGNRYGDYSKAHIEPLLKEDENGNYSYNPEKFKIQLEIYNWFGDLTAGNGERSWCQEYAESTYYRACRGGGSTNNGAAYSGSYDSYDSNSTRGFRPVLEEIPSH